MQIYFSNITTAWKLHCQHAAKLVYILKLSNIMQYIGLHHKISINMYRYLRVPIKIIIIYRQTKIKYNKSIYVNKMFAFDLEQDSVSKLYRKLSK